MGSLGGKRKEGVKARLCSRCTRCRFFHPIRRYIGHEIVVPSCRMLRFDFHFNRMDWEFGRIGCTHASGSKNSPVNLHKLRLKYAQVLSIYFSFNSLDSDFDFARGLDPRVRYIVSGVKFLFRDKFYSRVVCFCKVNLHGR